MDKEHMCMISEARCKIIEEVSEYMDCLDQMDLDDLGKIADIIKDVCEAEKDAQTAHYYVKVTGEMTEKVSANERIV